jgi:hypothetical protein
VDNAAHPSMQRHVSVETAEQKYPHKLFFLFRSTIELLKQTPQQQPKQIRFSTKIDPKITLNMSDISMRQRLEDFSGANLLLF